MNNKELKFKSKKTAIYHRINKLLAEREMTEADLNDKMENGTFQLKSLLDKNFDMSLRDIAIIEAALGEKLLKFKRNLEIDEED